MRPAVLALACSFFWAASALAQPECLAQAQHLAQLSPEVTQRTFLIEGERATFVGASPRCVGAVAVAPLHARLRLTLLSGDGEALASSEEHANSAYAMRCGHEGEVHLFVEMLRGAGEVHVALGAVAGSRRQSWEARAGACFSPPVGAEAPDNEVGAERVVGIAELAAARMEPWIRRGWQPVGIFRGSEIHVDATGCVRVLALSNVLVEVPRLQRRGASLSFCLDGESSFQVRMDRPGAMAVLRRDQFESPQHIPSVLWSEARAQGALSRHVRVRGSPGETWEDAVDLPDGCHRVVAFGRGAVLSVHSQEEPLRQRRVEGWSQVLFCGAGERRLKLRFLAPASDVRLFLGDV